MKNYTYKLTEKELSAKPIKEITEYLNDKIGEYNNTNVKYTNEYIAELIYLNCPIVTSLENDQAGKIISIMAMFIKYIAAYINNDEPSLKRIEKKVKNNDYAGVHYFLKESIFEQQLTDEQKAVLHTLFKKPNKLDFIIAFNQTKNLFEIKNQLYLQPVLYNKVEASLNSYILTDVLNRRQNPKKR